jgi:RNA polymerase sigma-70 factor (ECF subfamily)
MRTGFEDVVLPHLDSAYRLALWLLANGHDAADAVEEAARRARRQLHTLAGTGARAWFLGIVHRTCSGWHGCPRVPDEAALPGQGSSAADSIRGAIASLPAHLRAVIVLRDLEDLSYRELADAIGIPVGAAVTRLSCARRALHDALRGRDDAVRLPQEECCEVGQ